MKKERDVKEVKIKGLNSSDTINNVDDGWCEKLHNIAWRDGKFQTVCDHTSENLLQLDDYKIRYIHPLLKKGEYIATKDHQNKIYLLKTTNEAISNVEIIAQIEELQSLEDATFFHFEETLFVKYTVDATPIQQSFVYKNGAFTPYTANDIEELSTIEFSYDTYRPLGQGVYNTQLAIYDIAKDDSGNVFTTSVNRIYQQHIADFKQRNFIYGAVYLIFAFKLKDGTIVRNSKIYMLDTENGLDWEKKTFYKVINKSTPNQLLFTGNLSGFKVRISFYDMEKYIANDAISSIVVYSTRNTPQHNYENLFDDFPKDDFIIMGQPDMLIHATNSKYILDKRNLDLLSTPFYVVSEVDFRSTNTIALSAQSYENIELKPIFTPTASPHKYIPQRAFSLNGRLHQYNISASLCPSSMPILNVDHFNISIYKHIRKQVLNESELLNVYTTVTLNISGELVTVTSKGSNYAYYRISRTGQQEPNPYIALPNILSYPDVRATKMDIYFKRAKSLKEVETILIKSVVLQPVAANNYAVYRDMGADAVTFHQLFDLNKLTSSYVPPQERRRFTIPNQLMVSQIGNPNIFMPQNIYYIGDNSTTTIEDVNMPIDQLTESRFGQYPLYLFTNTGIYAMEQGTGNVLYQSIVKVNNDKIVHRSNSVSAAGSLFYFTLSGLMRLTGHTSSFVSGKINNSIKDFLDNSKISFVPIYNEIVITNSNNNYALVYSLLKESWSTRDFSGQPIDYDTYIKENRLYNLIEEDETKPLNGLILTREMQLGSRQLKRLERLKIDILTVNNFKITVYASLDGEQWVEIMAKENDNYLKRSTSSWRWFKIKIEGKDFLIDELIFESFTRFVRHIK